MQSTNMGDKETSETEANMHPVPENEQIMEKKISKEIERLKFYLDDAEDLFQSYDYSEIKPQVMKSKTA